MAMQANSRPWMILNYAVSEPNEWTCRAIAEDLAGGERGHARRGRRARLPPITHITRDDDPFISNDESSMNVNEC